MKIIKKIVILIIVLILGVTFISKRFSSQEDLVKKDIQTIKKVVEMFEDELVEIGVSKEMIDNVVTKIEEYNNETKYVIAFDIQNDTNPILSTTLHLPVSEDFFNSVEIGDKIAEEELEKIKDFAQLDQNFGSWIIVVKNKEIRE